MNGNPELAICHFAIRAADSYSLDPFFPAPLIGNVLGI